MNERLNYKYDLLLNVGALCMHQRSKTNISPRLDRCLFIVDFSTTIISCTYRYLYHLCPNQYLTKAVTVYKFLCTMHTTCTRIGALHLGHV